MTGLNCDVAIIGAGPAGSTAAAMLAQKGYDVVVLERASFPRFSIGESLLPQCMAYLEEANLLDAVQSAGFQPKNGAAFYRNGRNLSFDFEDKFTAGWSTTFQVQRARFDTILASEAEKAGADIRYQHEMVSVDLSDHHPVLIYKDSEGDKHQLTARFCFDASGFARKLAQTLDLDKEAEFPPRRAVFAHVVDKIDPDGFDRNKILISVHPNHPDIWYWLIPFGDGTSSLGVVGSEDHFSTFCDDEDDRILHQYVDEADRFGGVLANVDYHQTARQFTGYSSTPCHPYGQNFALLGNAAGFLDPIFSSGVTIALKSANLGANMLDRQFQGETVDWQSGFADKLAVGVDTFRHFVRAWYDGRLQDIIFAHQTEPHIKRMICSILAGYAWDEANPFVSNPRRRITVLADLCRQQQPSQH